VRPALCRSAADITGSTFTADPNARNHGSAYLTISALSFMSTTSSALRSPRARRKIHGFRFGFGKYCRDRRAERPVPDAFVRQVGGDGNGHEHSQDRLPRLSEVKRRTDSGLSCGSRLPGKGPGRRCKKCFPWRPGRFERSFGRVLSRGNFCLPYRSTGRPQGRAQTQAPTHVCGTPLPPGPSSNRRRSTCLPSRSTTSAGTN